MNGERLIELATASLRVRSARLRIDSHEATQSICHLAQSIASVGIIEPIVVRKTERGLFEVVAGERRLIAARMLSLEFVPCIVRDCSDSAAVLTALAENWQRSDLSAIEKARGLEMLIEEFGLTQEDVAKRIGTSQSTVAHHLRLLTLPQEVLQLIHDGSLSMGHGKLLAGVENPKKVIALAQGCVSNSKSVRELEGDLSKLSPSARKRRSEITCKARRIELELPNGVFLLIKDASGDMSRGTIEIPFYSIREKEWVLAALGQRLGTASRHADTRPQQRVDVAPVVQPLRASTLRRPDQRINAAGAQSRKQASAMQSGG